MAIYPDLWVIGNGTQTSSRFAADSRPRSSIRCAPAWVPSMPIATCDEPFVGSSQPTRELSLVNNFDVFNHALRFSALFEYRGGHYLLNDTERIRCQSRSNCRGLTDKSASLDDQARVVAMREHSSQTRAGFIEDASFVRWRELSVT